MTKIARRLSTFLTGSAFALALVTATVDAQTSTAPFPEYGIMPKREIGALRLLEKHADYDGRGVVVAVFDTGVDPGAAGLQLTSDGRPKVVDLVDATGSGDVDTSTTRQAKDGVLVGLSGRKLQLPDDLAANADREYHLGLKVAYELYPRALVPRLKRKRSEKFIEAQRSAESRIERELAELDVVAAPKERTPKEKRTLERKRKELRTRLDVLRKLGTSSDDPGPLFDCIVYHDGQHWRAMIDTDEDGMLADESRLTNYRVEREHATFGKQDQLNFAVNVYDEGNLLSIVADAGAHGTHVAGIIAGNYPKQPEFNGVAPGAQIVGVKIGDTRIGSSSLGTGEMRGLIAVLQNKCDLINMSYGGFSPLANQGRQVALVREIVDNHNVMFVASAGNNGPALTTVGSPGGTSSAILGVGAYVSPELMEVSYAMRERLPEIPFTWSSRGPAVDGDLGVDITAPGGAIASVPNWVLQRNQMMNGTSMSSPNACGAVALLMSAMMSEKLRYTPYSIRSALQNSARPLENSDPFAHGQGLLQVDRALQHLRENPLAPSAPLKYDVRLPRRNNSRGVYLREPVESSRRQEILVGVRPVFTRDVNPKRPIEYQQRIRFRCDAPWVECPNTMILVGGGKTFSIGVDPTELESGAHFTQIVAEDADAPERGPIFRVPITVIRPEATPASSWTTSLTMSPGEMDRQFLVVPEGATWADITLTSKSAQTQKIIVLHTAQLLPQVDPSVTSHREYVRLPADETVLRTIAVEGGRTLEVCIAQFWSSLGDGHYDVTVKFHGLRPSIEAVTATTNDRMTKILVSAPVGTESVKPRASLTHLRQSLRPTKFKMRPLLSDRDRLPEQRQIYEAVLTYSFELTARTEIDPASSLSQSGESWLDYESMMWLIFDAGKRRRAAGTMGDPTTLPKGKYTLRFHVRHDDPARLKSLEHLVMYLNHKLAKPISIGVYPGGLAALAGRPTWSETVLRQGDQVAIVLGRPSRSAVPSHAKSGDLLLGELYLGTADPSQPGGGFRPGGYPLTYVVLAQGGPTKSAAAADSKKPPTLDKRIADARLAHLTALRKQGKKGEKAFTKLAEELRKTLDDPTPVVLEELYRLDDGKDRKPHLAEIVRLTDEVLAKIDREELAAYFGRRPQASDEMDEAAKKERTRHEKQRDQLTDMLYRKARAIAYMDLPPKFGVPAEETEVARAPESKKERDALFEKTFAELRDWVDTTDKKYVLLHIRRERRQGRDGEALKLLNQQIDASPENKLFYSKRVDVLHELGWKHLRDRHWAWMKQLFRDKYPPF